MFKANLRFLYHYRDIVRSNFHHAYRLSISPGLAGAVVRDWISDWKRWSRAERCFAIMLVIIALVLPLGLLIVGGRIGS
jgi:hypothetical protein